MSLAQQIELTRQRNEAKLAAEVSPPKPQLETDALLHVRHFADWCKSRAVKFCPALPTTVAAFVRSEAATGVQPEPILESVRAIEAIHDNGGLANPVATAAVRSELSRIVQVEPPRSWRKSDRLLFAALPPEVRAVISRRARQDEIALRSLQNQVAAQRKSTTERKSNGTYQTTN